MTKLLDEALEAASNLPPDDQDKIARVVLRLAGTDDDPPVALSPEERAAIAALKAAAARGEFATPTHIGKRDSLRVLESPLQEVSLR